jgi:hypothetical protein
MREREDSSYSHISFAQGGLSLLGGVSAEITGANVPTAYWITPAILIGSGFAPEVYRRSTGFIRRLNNSRMQEHELSARQQEGSIRGKQRRK